MKKFLRTILAIVLCLMVLTPIAAYATTYSPMMTDLTVEIDDSTWYVFTRENIANNPELDALEVTYEEMEIFFNENEAYINAFVPLDDGDYLELVVSKRASSDGLAQLSDCTDSEVKAFASGGAEKFDTDDYSVYKTDYKFARVEYVEENVYVCRFITIVNNEVYYFDFNSPQPMDTEKYSSIEGIIDSVRFEVDESIVNTYDDDDGFDILTPVLVGGVTGGIGAFLRSRKNKKNQNNPNAQNNPNNQEPPTNSPEF